MSGGGMDWAYRMIAKHSLDPLGLAVVLHLGWRDAPAQRTDRGIARALAQHRSAVVKATAKLEALGVIVRRSGQWVAWDTVAIVEEKPGALRPGADTSDGVDHSVGRTTQWSGGGPLRGPRKDHSVVHKRKENIEKGEGVEMSAFQRALLREGKPVLVGSALLKPGTQAFQAAALAGRAQDAVEMQKRHGMAVQND